MMQVSVESKARRRAEGVGEIDSSLKCVGVMVRLARTLLTVRLLIDRLITKVQS
jgi:hypothetical protein